MMGKKFSSDELDKQGQDYGKEKSVNYSAYLYPYRYKLVRQKMRGPKVLEVGVGHADVTNWLSEEGNFEIVSIDGSQLVLDKALNKVSYPERVTFIHTYFEEFDSDIMFDDILITNSLEHVKDPIKIMKHMKKFLKDDGNLHISVPNAMSIHRMLGKEMGMLEHETSLNSHDVKVGHQRVYTFELLRKHVAKAGFKVVHEDGIILKTLSNLQLNTLIDTYGKELVEGLFAVGRRLPELSAEIYFCCQKC